MNKQIIAYALFIVGSIALSEIENSWVFWPLGIALFIAIVYIAKETRHE